MSEMDSKQHLSNNEAVTKLKEIAEAARTCMFVTDLTSLPSHAAPMSLQEVCDQGNLYFISSKESTRNQQIEKDSRVQLYFQNNSKYEYLSVYGEASILTDRATIDKYWTDFAKAWFEGKDDPNVTIIKVTPGDSYYWETKDGKIISFAKMALAAYANIKTNDGGVEGKLNT